MTKKLKRFLVVCAALALLAQGAVVYLLIKLNVGNSMTRDRLREIGGQLAVLRDPGQRKLIADLEYQWLSIGPENKWVDCIVKITPYTYHPGMRGYLSSGDDLAWDKENRCFSGRLTLSLPEFLNEEESYYFSLEEDGYSWTEWLEENRGWFPPGDLVFPARDGFANVESRRHGQPILLREAFALQEDRLPFGGKYKSGRLVVVDDETEEELYSTALDETGAAEIDEAIPCDYIQLRAEVLCEGGMTYLYDLYRMGWTREYYTGEEYCYYWSSPLRPGFLTAVFPDGTKLGLPIHW